MNNYNKNLTIVFQGKFDEKSVECVQRTATHFPSARLIVSCWEGDTSEIELKEMSNVDFIYSQDPGAIQVSNYKIDNINRQIESTRNGLNNVDTQYVLKLRTDSYLSSNVLLTIFTMYQARCNDKPDLFGSRVAVTNLTTLNANKTMQCFHICDWIFFGKTDDIKKIFSLSLKSDNYFNYYENTEWRMQEICSQYRAEAALIEHLVRKEYPEISFKHNFDVQYETIALSNKILKKNFVVLNPWSIGLKSIKHKKLNLWMDKHRYLESDWLRANGMYPSLKNQIQERFLSF